MISQTLPTTEVSGDSGIETGNTLTPDTEQPFTSPALRKYPSKLFVETTTRCNLKCQMCVKHTMGSSLEEGDMSQATFAALEPALPFVEALLLNGIGEPLLHRQLEEFIRRAKRVMPAGSWVGFQTNGLLLNEKRALSLVAAGLDRICLSLDAICPDTFRKIREGGEVQDMERAFRALEKARMSYPGSRLKIGVEFVVMRDNVHQLPDVLRWSAARDVSFAIVTNLIPYDKSHLSQIAYDYNTDAALEIYRKWKEMADREGIDLNDYAKAKWKMLRNPQGQKVVNLVQGMMAEGRSREVFIHVDNLLKRDHALIDEVQRIFDQARAVALETGLDLRLPEVEPKSDRKCGFVADGGAFVSWDGKIHPCYFLWHKFQCYFSGHKKHVNQRVFGDLAETGILEIWNNGDFRAFREEVMRHEYPFCSNCSLLPCEYLYAEEFEQDCYTNKVPCGDCFWCMGLFQCLS